MEVWLLWGLQPVTARGEDRVAAVTIGEHGLQIARGSARGLLLPGVAVEHHLDARRFLQQVCLKAGLPQEAWRQDDTTLMTFEGYAIRGPLAELDLGPAAETGGGPGTAEVARLADFCRTNLMALLQGATPAFYLSGGYDGGVHGLALGLGQPGSEGYVECSQHVAARRYALADDAVSPDGGRGRRVAIAPREARGDALDASWPSLCWAIRCRTAAWPSAKLAGLDPRPPRGAGGRRRRIGLGLRRPAGGRAVAAQGAGGGGPGRPAGRAGLSLPAVSTAPRMVVARPAAASKGTVPFAGRKWGGPRPPAAEVRPAAVAGGFYPGSAAEVRRQVEEMFAPVERKPEVWPAALVPHAGWMYSGRLAAAVLGRLAIPARVIVLAPEAPAGRGRTGPSPRTPAGPSPGAGWRPIPSWPAGWPTPSRT